MTLRPAKTAVVCTLTPILIASLTASPLAGTPRSRPPSHAAAAHARASAEKYWTAARMRQATPLDLVTAHGAHAKHPAIARPGTTGRDWAYGGAVGRTMGRIFFTTGTGENASCSGNVVNSANRSVVVTAGHCVRNGRAWNGAWVFVPGYHDGKRPHGTWVASMLATTPQWERSENTDYDVGMAVVEPQGGKRIADAVGAQAIGFGERRGRWVAAFGYPAEGRYDGSLPVYCTGDVNADTVGSSRDQALACDQTGGSSGGPWFVGFDGRTGVGTQYSVNSFKYADEPDYMYGPYFGQTVKDLYTWTAAR